MKSSFAPVGADEPTLLILGSLPGDRSLELRQYYGHPSNQFWRLLGETIGEDLAGRAYAERLSRLAERGIALWDVVSEAVRKGSLDADIREARFNPLVEFIEAQPALRAVAFNGQTAAREGRRVIGQAVAVELIDLPSSSAAHCTVDFAGKLATWQRLAAFVD